MGEEAREDEAAAAGSRLAVDTVAEVIVVADEDMHHTDDMS